MTQPQPAKRKSGAVVIALSTTAASVMWGFMVAVFCMGIFGWNPYVVWPIASYVAVNAFVFRIALINRRQPPKRLRDYPDAGKGWPRG